MECSGFRESITSMSAAVYFLESRPHHEFLPYSISSYLGQVKSVCSDACPGYLHWEAAVHIHLPNAIV